MPMIHRKIKQSYSIIFKNLKHGRAISMEESLSEIIAHVENSLYFDGARAYYDPDWIRALLDIAKEKESNHAKP